MAIRSSNPESEASGLDGHDDDVHRGDGSKWGKGLLSAIPDEWSSQKNRAWRGLKPFSRLPHASWAAANISYFKDLNRLPGGLRQDSFCFAEGVRRGQDSQSEAVPEEEAKEEGGKRRGRLDNCFSKRRQTRVKAAGSRLADPLPRCSSTSGFDTQARRAAREEINESGCRAQVITFPALG